MSDHEPSNEERGWDGREPIPPHLLLDARSDNVDRTGPLIDAEPEEPWAAGPCLACGESDDDCENHGDDVCCEDCVHPWAAVSKIQQVYGDGNREAGRV